MNKKTTIIGILIIVLAIFAAGCIEIPGVEEIPVIEEIPGVEEIPVIEEQILVVAGSSSVAEVAEYLAEAFMAKHPDILIEVQSIGTGAGILGAYGDIINIGMSSRYLEGIELGFGLNEFIICRDAIAAIVHPENPVTNISREDLKKIFTGEITNWNEVGGPNLSITVVIREEGSGTRDAFEDMVHEDIEPRPTVHGIGTGGVKARVAGDPSAIGYITIAVLSPVVSALKIDGVEASPATVLDGTYGIARPFIFLTKGTPDPLEQKFIDFVLGPDGQSLLEEEGMVRVD